MQSDCLTGAGPASVQMKDNKRIFLIKNDEFVRLSASWMSGYDAELIRFCRPFAGDFQDKKNISNLLTKADDRLLSA